MRVPPSLQPDAQQAFREVWAKLDTLTGANNIDLKKRRVINAHPAIDPFDYVTKFDLDQAVAGLSAGEEDRLSSPVGIPPTVLYGTHAERLALSTGTLKDGTLFYETDRAAIYQVQDDGTGTVEWWLVMCRPLRTADSKPADLGTNDAGFTWFDQVEGVTYRWSGGEWNYYLGSLMDVFTNMPSAALADRGFLFIANDYGDHVWRKMDTAFELVEGVGGPMRGTAATRATVAATLGANDVGFHFLTTDQGNQVWRWSGTAFVLIEGLGDPLRVARASLPVLTANDAGFAATITDQGDQRYRWSGTAWVYRVGFGTPMTGTLSPDQKPTLGANDVGFRFHSTDFDREFVWDGAAWGDADGAETRGQIAFFPITLHADFTPGNGWALCDGTAGVTRSTPTGGTTTVTVPDLTGSNRFLRSVSGATGGTGGSATTHTHPIDPPSTNSGAPSATVAVQSGAGTTVATDTHTHATDIASFDSGTPSGAGDDALPPYYNARPYLRL